MNNWVLEFKCSLYDEVEDWCRIGSYQSEEEAQDVKQCLDDSIEYRIRRDRDGSPPVRPYVAEHQVSADSPLAPAAGYPLLTEAELQEVLVRRQSTSCSG
jgi:hypothetical protein